MSNTTTKTAPAAPIATRNQYSHMVALQSNKPVLMLTGNGTYLAFSVAPRHAERLNKALVEPLNILKKGKRLDPAVVSYKVQVVTDNEFTYTIKVWVSWFNNEANFVLKALSRSFDVVRG